METKGVMIARVAFKEVGYKESPRNSNKTKYGKWFGFDGVPWCGMFVSWCYASAGIGTGLGNIGFSKGFAGCQTAVAHFKKTGEITKDPKVGDIVFFDWNGDGRYDHTGIFNGWKERGKIMYTIEGNTSLTNQSNGGEVMSRERIFNNLSNSQKKDIVIFVHPKVLD